LRNVTSGGVPTKVVVLGIGDRINEAELRLIASPPTNRTVILVENFRDLGTVEQQLLDESCKDKRVSFTGVLNRLSVKLF